MRVTFLTTQLSMATGGGSNPDRDARARAMKELGCDVKFITVFSKYNEFPTPFPAKVYEESLDPKKMNFFQFHRAIANLMRKYESETDVYFIDGHVFLLGAGLYRKSGGKPTVGYFEAYSFPTGTMKTPFAKQIKYTVFELLDKFVVSRWGNALDALLAVSPTTRDIFVARGLRKDKFHLLPNAMDYSIFQEKGEEFHCINTKKFHVLYSARITDDKGVDIFIRAMKELSDMPDIGADIIGEGPAKESFIQLTKELGLEDRVFWQPRVRRTMLGSVFRHADVFVYPTVRAEALGTASLDALANGTPVIVSSGTGMVWGVGEGGLVFENGNPKDLAAKIRILYQDENLRKSMAEKGQKRAQEFDYRKVSRDLLTILERVVRPTIA